MRALMTAAVVLALGTGAGCAAGEEARRDDQVATSQAPQSRTEVRRDAQGETRTHTHQETEGGYVVSVQRTERTSRAQQEEAAQRAQRAESEREAAARRAAEARARAESSAREAQRLQSERDRDQQEIAAARSRAQEEARRAAEANAELERRQQELDAARIAQMQVAQELEQQRAEMERQRSELEQQRAQLEDRERQLEREQQARADAERRAREALEQVAGVRQEARGLVVTLGGEVLFGFNETALLPSAQRRLDVVASALRQMGEGEVLIEGHTDSVGSEEYNEELSVRRAEVVRQYLQDRGVRADQIRANGVGELRPVASNGTAEGRAMNRRVEIILPQYGVGGAGQQDQGAVNDQDVGTGGGGAEQTGDEATGAEDVGTGGAGTDNTESIEPPTPLNGDVEGPPTKLDDLEEDELQAR